MKSNKQYIVGNDIIDRRGYSIGKIDAAYDANNDVLRDRQEYCVRSWLSLLGGNASTNVIDTQMLGIVTIELVLAPASILMQGQKNEGTAAVTLAQALPFRAEVNRTNIGAATTAIGAPIAQEAASYNLSESHVVTF